MALSRTVGAVLHRTGAAIALMPLALRDRNPFRSRLRQAVLDFYASQEQVRGWVKIPGTSLRCYADVNDEVIRPLVHHAEVFEAAEVAYFREFITPGSVVFDVGANYGLFGLRVAAAADVAAVHFFEPNPQVVACLRKTVRHYTRLPLRLHDCAVGAADGEATFYVPVSGAAGHGALERHAWGEAHGIFNEQSAVRVRVRSIDSMVEEMKLARLDCVKIDVEGGEGAVVAGMRRSLERLKPRVLMCETSVGSEAYEELRARYGRVVAFDAEGQRIEQDTLKAGFWGNVFFSEPRP